MKQHVRTRGTTARKQRWRASSLLLLLLVALPVLAAGVVKIERVSPPPLDLEVTLPSAAPSLSAEGRFVAFQSSSSGLEPARYGYWTDVSVRDRLTGETKRVGDGRAPVVSGDGRFVAFVDEGDDEGQVRVWDRQTGKTEIASAATGG